ncbi:hypothetical protein BJV77DRAFT_968209 [Russula vinacea]|nr:hypothetical protein BJV77DRAFT_968209 [Russula vinacea]
MACKNVHDQLRAWTALNALGVKINWVQASPKQQHKPPSIPSYELCRVDFYFSPQSEEPSILTLLQNAAPVRVLSDFAATLLIPRLPRKSSFAVCKDVHDRSRSQLVPQLFKKNSRSGRDDEGEHSALSWEEIPSPASFFFSWEENWGTQRLFLVSLTPPHALVALATSHQRALYFDRFLHKVTSCAELCTTSCVQYSPLIPSSTAQLAIPFLQNSAYARALSNLHPMLPKCRPLVLPKFATCGSVLDRSRAWSALYLPGARISSVQVFFRVPCLRADLATQPQPVPRIDRYLYSVMSCAKACTAARAQDCHFFPQQVELLSLSLLWNAALARGLSAFVTTRLRPRQLCLPSYAGGDQHLYAQKRARLLAAPTSSPVSHGEKQLIPLTQSAACRRGLSNVAPTRFLIGWSPLSNFVMVLEFLSKMSKTQQCNDRKEVHVEKRENAVKHAAAATKIKTEHRCLTNLATGVLINITTGSGFNITQEVFLQLKSGQIGMLNVVATEVFPWSWCNV